jgi:hypothetical protein
MEGGAAAGAMSDKRKRYFLMTRRIVLTRLHRGRSDLVLRRARRLRGLQASSITFSTHHGALSVPRTLLIGVDDDAAGSTLLCAAALLLEERAPSVDDANADCEAVDDTPASAEEMDARVPLSIGAPARASRGRSRWVMRRCCP